MTLFWSSRSPFVRKVMVAAHETGLAHCLNLQRVIVSANRPNPEVMAANPLNKIPTLVLADGSALYDLRVICEFFDTLQQGPALFPCAPSARWRALRLQALGDGLMDVILLRLGEQNRAAAAQSATHLSSFCLKLAAALDELESELTTWAGGSISAKSRWLVPLRTWISDLPPMAGVPTGRGLRLGTKNSQPVRPCG